MRVKQLIELLEKHDPNHDVVISSYEYGVMDLDNHNIELVTLRRNYYGNGSYGGPHERFELQSGELGDAIYIG